MKKLRITLSTAVMLLVLSLCGCGKKVVTYTTEDYITVSVSGVNGEGRLTVQSGTDEFFRRVNDDVFEGKGSEIDLASMAVNIAAYADYNVSSMDNLSNGDTVTITMTADNESLRELGLEFALDEYVYTVEGLAEPQELDVWTGLEVTFTGISPDGSAEAVYNGSDTFVKENVRYSIDSAWGLSNGDTVKVTASCSQSALDENNYVLSETEKTFTAQGLSFYPADLSEYDITEIENILYENAKEETEATSYSKAYKDGSLLKCGRIFDRSDLSEIAEEWSVTEEPTITPKHKFFLANSSDKTSKNKYTIFYEVVIPVEKTAVDRSYGSDDGYSIGDTYTLVLYVESHMDGIISDGKTLDISGASTDTKFYGRSMWGNYIGSTLDELEEEYTSSYSEWIKTEIE